jgi:muconolactone delta-isomerase
MLFKVDMTVNIPLGFPAAEARKLNNEKAYSHNYSVKANGDISGASPVFTPMSVFSMCEMPKSYIKY